MIPHSIYEEIKNDLPWGERIRILVGNHSSREIIKDSIFKYTNLPVMPGLWVGSFSTIASEILQLHHQAIPISLSSLNKTDIIQKIADVKSLKEKLPQLTRQLRDRKVASKLVQFIDELDEHYIHDNSLQALLEYYGEKNPGIADFIEWVIQLWKTDHLSHWSGASILRSAIRFEKNKSLFKNKKIYLFAFIELTPIEEELIKVIKENNDVIWLLPEDIKESSQIQKIFVDTKFQDPDELEITPHITLWNPHSFYDEIQMLKSELEKSKKEGIEYSEIAIKLPQNDQIKRIVRDQLNEWNVPIQDPTLSSDLYDDHSFMKSVSFLKTLAHSMPIHMLYSFIEPKHYEILKDISYENGFRNGVSKWKKCIPHIESEEVKKLIQDFVICYESFVKFRTTAESLENCKEQVKTLVGESGFNSLIEFSDHLLNQRPYLAHTRIKVSKVFEYYEEYIIEKINRESMRNSKGLHLVQHNLWFPIKLKKMICLSTHEIEQAERKLDAWHLEEIRLKNTWKQLHQELDFSKKIQFELDLLRWSIVNHHQVIISACDYNIEAKPVTKGVLFNLYSKEYETVLKGSHPQTGWTMKSYEPRLQIVSNLTAVEKIKQDQKIGFTRFEAFLKCPYIYYSQYVVQADKAQEVECEPDKLTRGNMIHKIFEIILKTDFKKDLKSIVTEVVQASILKNITKKTIAGMHESPKLIENTIAQLTSQAFKFYEYTKAKRLQFPNLRNIYLEKHVETSFDYEKGKTLTLTGVVDRIDSDGENVIVIDYKTSKSVLGGSDLIEGTGAQLFGYLRAASALTNQNPVAAFYMQIDRSIKDNQGIFLKKYNKKCFDVHPRVAGLTELSFDEIEDKVLTQWKTKAKNLMDGIFTPNPARPEKDCNQCRYQEMCGFKYE